MLHIREADDFEYDRVRNFYYTMIDALQGAQYTPGWQKDVYPANSYLRESIEKHQLFIGTMEERIVSAMIVNHEWNESYVKASWKVEAGQEEVTVIHALGVHPDFSGQGFAREMVRHVIERAAELKQKSIRLDVLKGNLPAERLYVGIGFRYIDTIPMYYEDTGLTDYMLYEYRL